MPIKLFYFANKNMLTNRQIFFNHLGLPSANPTALEIEKAEGIFLWDNKGKKYTDLVSGVSVSNVGHRHPRVLEAINTQLDKYMHLMVYGEYIQSPQVKLAEKLIQHLPSSLNSVYFVNSGSEAIEGAMKLAKRITCRQEIVAFNNAYHGSTHGALSILGSEKMKYAFRPLLPEIRFLDFNSFDQISQITTNTACVVIEPVQAEAGIILPEKGFLQAIRKRCNDCEVLLVYDEVQMGFGRSGKLFCFENEQVIPDILCLAKGMGGGMPIGAFVASKKMMDSFTFNPALGHITTFGGHPVCSAAALASLEIILDEQLAEKANEKGKRFYNKLINQKGVQDIRIQGLMLAVEINSEGGATKLIPELLKSGLIVDQFLFNQNSFRIAPPLTITDIQIDEICITISNCLNS